MSPGKDGARHLPHVIHDLPLPHVTMPSGENETLSVLHVIHVPGEDGATLCYLSSMSPGEDGTLPLLLVSW